MKELPLISVVIPSYNSARYVLAAVDSALQQTYSPVEIVVVDDGSTDNTREVLEARSGKIRYVYQPNGGLSSARNRGIQESKGELLAFLDADDQFLPEKLEKQWHLMQSVPGIGLVHCDLVRLFEPNGDLVYKKRDRERFSGECYHEFFRGNAMIPSAVLVRRSCIDQVGGEFDPKIRGASTQDMDMWLRISRVTRFGYVNEPLVLYRDHPNNASRNLRMMYEDELYVLQKALNDDPPLRAALGAGYVKERMSGLAYAAGYANVQLGDYRRARRYFGIAMKHEKLLGRNGIAWAATFAPAGIQSLLRSAKQRMSGEPKALAPPGIER